MEKQTASQRASNNPEQEQGQESAAKGQSPSASGAATAFIFLAIILSLAAGGFTFLLSQKLEQMRAEVNQQQENTRNNLSQLTMKVKGDMQAQLISLTDKIARISSEQQQFQTQVAEQQKITEALSKKMQLSNQQMLQSIKVLFKQKGRERIGWVLEEVEYLLLVANHSLKLQHNVATAIAALEAADARLLDTGDPGTIEIRTQIRDEIQSLKALQQPDIVGMAASLASLIKLIPELPIKYTQIDSKQKVATMVEKKAAEDKAGLKQASKVFLHELRSLVVFRKLDKKPEPLMTPEQQFFLQQNLQLKLETARTALLMGQKALFRDSLQEAISWLKQYFDSDVRQVNQTLQELNRLQKMNIISTMPDISRSIKMLRRYQHELENSKRPAHD